MKTIKFVGYLLYSYVSKSQRVRTPYFNTLVVMTFLGFLHLFQILILFDKTNLIAVKSSNDKLTNRVIMFFVMLPLYLLMTRLFKKSDISPLQEKYDYNWDKVFNGYVWLIVYIIASFATLITLSIIKKALN